jgi:hypothetical protein
MAFAQTRRRDKNNTMVVDIVAAHPGQVADDPVKRIRAKAEEAAPVAKLRARLRTKRVSRHRP